MADDQTPSADSVSTASSDPVSSSPASESSPQDTRSIAESVFADSGEPPAAPPAANVSADAPPPAAATSDAFDENDPIYLKLLASGSMPVDRHQAAMTNARNKAQQKVEQEFRAKYGWADTFDRQRAEHGLGILNGLEKDAATTLRNLSTLLGVDLTPQAPKEPEGPPPPDVKLDDGSEFYSAAQLSKLRAWQDAQYDKKLQALEERWKPIEQERHLAKLEKVAKAEAGDILSRYRATRKHFAALEPDIKALMLADPTLDLPDAYSLALETKLIPQQQAQATTDRASQLQRKAAASMPGPGAARPVTPLRDRDRSTRDIVAEEFARMSR
jgi:hypothetical protein